MPQERYLSIKEAANTAGVSNRTIQRAFDADQLSGVRSVYGRLISPESLDNWMDKRSALVLALPYDDTDGSN
jgi:excisionase family DNA binding protein